MQRAEKRQCRLLGMDRDLMALVGAYAIAICNLLAALSTKASPPSLGSRIKPGVHALPFPGNNHDMLLIA